MFNHFRRRRRDTASKAQALTEVPWDKYLEVPAAPRLSEDSRQDATTDESAPSALSPSIDSPSLPPTPCTPLLLPESKPEEKTFRTNGEYYDQLLLRTLPQASSRPNPARSPELNGNSTDSEAAGRPRRPPTLRNIGPLRGMPLPKRTPITTSTPDVVDPRSPLKSPPPTPSRFSRLALMPITPRKKATKPKSLTLKVSAFQTKAKSIVKKGPTSASLLRLPKPSPVGSAISSTSTARVNASPLTSAASAPAPSSKWRGEFRDLLPQFAVPQSAVPRRSKRPEKYVRDRKKFTSDLGSMPDDLLGGYHISPPMMTTLFTDDPIPAAFLSASTSRSNHGLSARSVASNASVLSANMSSLRSTELVVKKNTQFELPVSSGKALLFS